MNIFIVDYPTDEEVLIGYSVGVIVWFWILTFYFWFNECQFDKKKK